jgi:hypothetical protein
MCGLLLKCAALTVMIHGFRALGRLAGPRWSALALGLPSTTAVVLFMCGCERGSAAATAMAESSLLGLVAAVALPLAYAAAVRRAQPLAGALATAIGGYLLVASVLGSLAPEGPVGRIALALLAIVAATSWARMLPTPLNHHTPELLTGTHAVLIRTAVPMTFSIVLWIVQRVAGPSGAGLVSTFPSMSLVVLAVTHLEAGPAEASRIAKLLPTSNVSTLAFLATFHAISLRIGLMTGMFAGYAAAVLTMIVMERHERIVAALVARVRRLGRSPISPWRLAMDALDHARFIASAAHVPRAPRYLLHKRARQRVRFAPRVETLVW